MDRRKLGTTKGVEVLKFILNILGCWPKKLPYWLTILYSFYSLNILIIFLFLYDVSLSTYIGFIQNVEEATNNLCMTITLITLFGKVLNFKFFLNEIQNLLQFGEEFELDTADEKLLFDQRIVFFNKIIIFLYLSANAAGSSIYVGAFLSSEVRLPYLAWFPFDWKSNYTSYVFLYIYQVVGMIIQSNLNVTMDLFSAYLMHIGSVKLEIIGKRLQKLSEFTVQGELNLCMDNRANKNHVSSLVRCIASYQRVWKYTQRLQNYFTYGFFIQISLSGVVICFIAYQLTNTSPTENFALYVYMVMFLICMVTQMSLPCYFGNEIILKHQDLRGCAFQSGWHLQSIKYRKIVIVFMESVKKRRSIFVGNLFDLDLNLFTSIMNFAYRLYAVLV